MKVCSRCHVEKDDLEFHRRGKTRLQSLCKECNKLYLREHYKSHKNDYLHYGIKTRKKIKQFVDDLKTAKPCADCGLIYPPYVMDFDHQDNKSFDIAWAVAHKFGLDRIQKEIDKCELVCANCHRERTHNKKDKNGSGKGTCRAAENAR